MFDINVIATKFPSNFKLPKSFYEFEQQLSNSILSNEGFVYFENSKIENLYIDEESTKNLVPFLKIGDGGIIAFWLKEDNYFPIVYLGTEGQIEVCAESFEKFIVAIKIRKINIDDFSYDAEFIDNLKCEQTNYSDDLVKELSVEFKAYMKNHSTQLDPFVNSETEIMRLQIYKKVIRMLQNGLSKVYNENSTWWSMDFAIKITDGKINVEYLDYGKMYKLPSKYRLENDIEKLRKYFKHFEVKKFEIKVWCKGGISINNDTELLLVPEGN
jgi:hypothetical protein